MSTPSAPAATTSAASTTQPLVATGGTASPTSDAGSVQEVAEAMVRRSRLTYGFLLVVGFILGELMQIHVIQWMTKWRIEDAACSDVTCLAAQGIYRTSFALFLFFLVHYIVSSPCNLCMTPKQRVQFSTSYFLPKILLLIPIYIVCFVIPNDFFVFFAWLCVVLSCLFLVGQQIVLLEFAYSWSDSWSTKGDEGDNKFYVGLLLSSVVMILLSLTFVGLSYWWFAPMESCQMNIAMITITLIAALMYTPLSIYMPSGSVLPSATVFLYTTWTCFSALASSAPGECNHLSSGNTSLYATLIGAVFSCVSLVYCSVNAATSRDAFKMSDDDEQAVSEEEAEASCFSFFHAQMMLGSCYLAMLLSNWTVVGSSHMATMNGSAVGAQWAKFASELVCIFFYTWTLVAPKLCPSRFQSDA